jgi:hypothetical protein
VQVSSVVTGDSGGAAAGMAALHAATEAKSGLLGLGPECLGLYGP